MNAGPLEGIKVVELGNAIAGPMCAMLLGDMGAEVIKVEVPGKGDDSRHWGELVKGESPYFLQYNRNKRSLTVDLRKAEGHAILLKILEKADVFVENYRPQAVERLGLSYDKVSGINPRLVYCSISGFGQWGPYRDLGGYDAIIQGMCGMMVVNGEEERPPVRVGVPITDILAALYGAFSVSAALMARERTDQGQMIDVSLLEAGVSAVSQWVTISQLTRKAIPRFGNNYPLLAPYEEFVTKDQPIMVAVGNEELWMALCRVLGREELATDPRFETNARRIVPENRRALARLLEASFSKKPAEEWVKALWLAGIPAGVINNIEALPRDEHLRSRGVFSRFVHSVLGEIALVTASPKLAGVSGKTGLPPPTLGQHTLEVLGELDFTPDEIARFKSEGVI